MGSFGRDDFVGVGVRQASNSSATHQCTRVIAHHGQRTQLQQPGSHCVPPHEPCASVGAHGAIVGTAASAARRRKRVSVILNYGNGGEEG